MTNKYHPAAVVELSEDDGGGFLAYAPDLYGCMGDGESPEEALRDLQRAVQEWCDETARLGREIPEPGSASRTMQEERTTLLKVIEDQERLLERQGTQFAELKAEVEALKGEIERVVRPLLERQRGGEWGRTIPAGPPGNARVAVRAH